ncbi:MAG: AAA family ATPase, partial [Bacteroidota bacterium]
IFDGNFSATYAERMARADTFVWLDVPLWRRLWRVLRRTVVYRGRTRPDLPEGCPERLGWQTLSFVHFILVSNRRSRAKLKALYDSAPTHVRALRLRTSDEIEAFLTPEASGAVRLSPEA